jgi:hypothetical protein
MPYSPVPLIVASVLVTTIAGVALPVRAQAPSGVPATSAANGDPYAACRHEPDDRRRLSCYDREFDRRETVAAQNVAAATNPAPRALPAAPVPAPAPVPAVAAPQLAAAPLPSTPAQPPAPSAAPAAAVPPAASAVPKPRASAQRLALFHATITEMHFRGAGEFVITLDNGQVWTQYTVEGKPRIAVGDRVTIRPGWLGTYILSGPTEWITKVHPLEDG